MERLQLNKSVIREQLKPKRLKLMNLRKRVSLLFVADVLSMYPSTIDTWRQDNVSSAPLPVCPADPPITKAYSEINRIEFYEDDLIAWLKGRHPRHSLLDTYLSIRDRLEQLKGLRETERRFNIRAFNIKAKADPDYEIQQHAAKLTRELLINHVAHR